MLLRNKYGLKKPGDFTVSEGHGYPLVLYNESKHNISFALVGKADKIEERKENEIHFEWTLDDDP
jgi:hypothetical protein